MTIPGERKWPRGAGAAILLAVAVALAACESGPAEPLDLDTDISGATEPASSSSLARVAGILDDPVIRPLAIQVADPDLIEAAAALLRRVSVSTAPPVIEEARLGLLGIRHTLSSSQSGQRTDPGQSTEQVLAEGMQDGGDEEVGILNDILTLVLDDAIASLLTS